MSICLRFLAIDRRQNENVTRSERYWHDDIDPIEARAVESGKSATAVTPPMAMVGLSANDNGVVRADPFGATGEVVPNPFP
jgi:hypothetical protein